MRDLLFISFNSFLQHFSVHSSDVFVFFIVELFRVLYHSSVRAFRLGSEERGELEERTSD